MRLLTSFDVLRGAVEKIVPRMEKMTYAEYQKINVKKLHKFFARVDSLEGDAEDIECTIQDLCPKNDVIARFLKNTTEHIDTCRERFGKNLVDLVNEAIDLEYLNSEQIQMLIIMMSEIESKQIKQVAKLMAQG